MDWKSFLKPTKSKLGLAAVLFLLFVPFINYDNGIRCIRAPCPADTTGSVVMYSLQVAAENWRSVHIYHYELGLLAIGTIAAYLASCLLVFAYSRVKK